MKRMAENNSSHKVYIVDGARTPFLKVRDRPNPFSASDLAVYAGKALFERLPFEPDQIGEVVLGCVMPRENEANIARVASLRMGCGNYVPAWTVQRNCGSGMQAIDSGLSDIKLGRYDMVVAGGTEAMSHAPLIYSKDYVLWLAKLRSSKSLGKKAQALTNFRPKHLVPEIALRTGLSDPIVGLSMGQTAEIVAQQFHITRTQMDQFAVESHQKVAAAMEKGYLANELVTLYDNQGNFYDHDTGVRPDSSVEKLATLKPFFDKFGNVTAGNSSQVTDGAVVVLLANERAVEQHNLPVLGSITAVHWAALPPEIMGLGPIYAATPLMQKLNLKIEDIDYWEINEAFAAQVIGCQRAWDNDEFCRKELGLKHKMGMIPSDRLNVDGGAVALGHPVGASGGRIILHLLQILKRNNAKRGMAMICMGGGQGGAMLLERE
jgi:acetyl-CoA C-acetyltransferase